MTQIKQHEHIAKGQAITRNNPLLEWINERYITTRKKFIEQYVDKETGETRYITYYKD
jgi:hypothetical protein